MKRILTTLFSVAVAAIAVSAQTVTAVTTAAGTLKSVLTTAPDRVATLIVQGPVDAGDLEFINTKMTSLESLDLKAATIEAYYGAGHDINGIQRYDANYVPEMIFAGLKAKTLTLPTTEKLRIGEAAFVGAALTTVTIPANVGMVGDGAFAGCPALTSVVVKTNTGLGTDIFANCTSLTKADISALTEVPVRMFDGCTMLSDVIVNPNYTAISSAAFRGCKALKSFDFVSTLTSLQTSAFECSGLQKVDMTACQNLFAIGKYAFANCNDLTEAMFADNIVNILDGALFNCDKLTKIQLPAGISGISAAMLSNTRIAGKLELPKMLMSIGDYALTGCSVSELDIPASVFYLGDEAMSDMSELKRIDVSKHISIPSIGADVWSGVDQSGVKLIVADDMYGEFKTAEQWKEFDIEMVSGTDDIASETADVSVKGRFEGTDLHIVAAGVLINRVELYDVSGALLTAVDTSENEIVIPTADYSTRVYVVNVLLANGNRAAVKIMR